MKTEMTLMKATIETNTNLTYVIDEENRTVECTVKNCIDDFFNVIDRKIKGYKDNKIIATLIDFMTFSLDSDITIKDTYSAIARCDEVDIFDIELGKDLVRSRALAKREEAYGQAINRIYEILNDTSNFITSIRNVVDLHNKHKTNAEAITVSGKTLKEIRGF